MQIVDGDPTRTVRGKVDGTTGIGGGAHGRREGEVGA